MTVQYLETEFTEAKSMFARPNLTKDGYTSRRGSPSHLMIKLGKRWHRIYLFFFSNNGSSFVRVKGEVKFLTAAQWTEAQRLADREQKNQGNIIGKAKDGYRPQAGDRVVSRVSGAGGEIVKVNRLNKSSPFVVRWDRSGTKSNENLNSIQEVN